MNQINLMELFEQGIVKEGAHIVNVPIKRANGTNYNGRTYMIPLKYLYYNDQNGRIGVALSEYESNHRGEPLEPGHNEEYNMVIQKMLAEKESKDKMDALVADVKKYGQQESGYVLNDGRVIDGNRRFTAKRLLSQGPDVVNGEYFEAVILDDLHLENRQDKKMIKELELQIQFGKMEKENYNPIDMAIDAYKTIVQEKIMTQKEYADKSKEKNATIEKRVLEAELIIKFLKFIPSGNDNYAIAKEWDLDGPLQDIVPQYKKFKNTEREKMILDALFAKIVQIRTSREDFKGEFRNIVKNIVNTNPQAEEKFLESMEDAVDTLQDVFAEAPEVTNKVQLVELISKNKDIQESLVEVKKQTYKASEEVINKKDLGKPVELARRAINSISAIDQTILKNLPTSKKIELERIIYNIEETLTDIKERM